MTINILEVFNFVLKDIYSLPVYGIMDYTFHKCNEYFVNRGRKHASLLQKGSVEGNLAENTFLNKMRYQIMKLSCYLIPQSLYTRSSRQAGLILVVNQEDAYSELRLVML
jgi:hypothetical protein